MYTNVCILFVKLFYAIKNILSYYTMNLLLILAIILVIISISTGVYFYMNTSEKKYPFWGWDKHAGLRCKNNDNTGCNTAYDKNGKLVEIGG